jgi:hypothetical protein
VIDIFKNGEQRESSPSLEDQMLRKSNFMAGEEQIKIGGKRPLYQQFVQMT